MGILRSCDERAGWPRVRGAGGTPQMAYYRLYCTGASGNSCKVALYLNCAGLDWEPVGIDFAGGQTRDANWRPGAKPMGGIPGLEVAGRGMSQSGAFLCWLGETTGRFPPAGVRPFKGCGC